MTAFDPAWLSNPEVFSVGTLPPVSDHRIFADAAEAERGESSLVRSLDGTWGAHLALNPDGAPDELLTGDSLDGDLLPLTVPGEFQLQYPGWDPPHYVNYQYPWDGHEALVPPQVSREYNPTVTAVRRFDLTAADLDCGRIVLTFEGVEAAVCVCVNGTFAGYAEDSFTPHRFDITALVHAGENRLAARVFKRCSGSWMEDQDFWRFSGIHRSVTLTFEPRTHLADIFVKTPLEEEWTRAYLDAELAIDRPAGTVELTLADAEGQVLLEASLPQSEKVALRREVPGVRLWSAEDPALYTLNVTLTDPEGRVTEVSSLQTGFRQFEMIDRVMCLNGKRIVFHGVNRHEFDCDRGRVMTEELLLRDLRDMKGMNVNAVRTCHYPNTSLFYRLCDRFGFYVIDETNIETHGTWARENPAERAVPADRPEWREAVLARGRAMQERDKNHPCVLLWSCGNESWGGSVLFDLSEQFRRRDSTRLVHYEGCWNDPVYGRRTSDVYSRMYFKAAEIEEYLRSDPDRPFINCEYTHAMGNSCGGMSLYRDLEDRWPMYQGGFIWDYVDQGLRCTSPDGKPRLAYGGDYGDRPCDWQFNTNGIVLGDRTLTPKVQEVRRMFADVKLDVDADGVTVRSLRRFAPLKGFDLRWSVVFNRESWAEGLHSLPEIAPGESLRVELPWQELPDDPGETVLTCELCVAENTGLLPRGHQLAFGQTVIGAMPETAPAEPLPLIAGDQSIGVRGLGAMMTYREGLLSLRDAAGRETMLRTPLLSLFRAPTDNDNGNRGSIDQGIWHMVSRYSALQPGVIRGNSVLWRWENRLLPGMKLELTVTPRTDGLHFRLCFGGVAGQPDLPAFGLAFPLDPRLHHVSYFGLGPEENYIDRCEGAWLGWHAFDSREGVTRYEKPQESGSRRAVSCLRLTDDDGHGLELTGDRLEVSVLPNFPEELSVAYHQDELGRSSRTVLDVAAFRKGVGGDDSWGAPVLPQFTYPSDQPRELNFILRGI